MSRENLQEPLEKKAEDLKGGTIFHPQALIKALAEGAVPTQERQRYNRLDGQLLPGGS
jgi:hypothetical protein